MKNFVKSFQLLNFQSWNNTSKPITLESDIINIIEGANETGKSVLYKVLYNMAFPGYWKSNELIRRGCSTAMLLLSLADGKAIVYQLTHKSHTYFLIDETQEKAWQDCPIPDEIVAELGLVLDRESKVILNVIDKDVALPFIKSSPKSNASYIRAVVEPPSMTEFFSHLEEQTNYADAAQTVLKSKADAASQAAEVLEFRDINQLKIQKSLVDALIPTLQILDKIDDTVQHYTQLLSQRPIPVTDPCTIEPLINIYANLEYISSGIAELENTIATKPIKPSSPEYIKPCIDLYEDLQILTDSINQHIRILSTKPQQVTLPDLSSSFAIVQNISDCTNALKALAALLLEVQQHKLELTNLSNDLEQMRKDFGVCPTCGQLLRRE